MPRLEITTPEQVTFHYPIAGLVTRAVAWSLDLTLLLLLDFAIFLIFLWQPIEIGFAFATVTVFLLNFGYYIGFELFSAGQTLGKRAMGIRVVSVTGSHLRFSESFLRNVVRMLDMGLFFVGAIVAFVDPLRRRLGDLVADTIVVRDTRRKIPDAIIRAQARANSFHDDVAIRTRILNRVTREERDLILDLMSRRDQLEPRSRESIFAGAAAYLRQRYSLPSDMEHLSDEQTVLGVALVILSTRFTG
jgi:uncharacterized RDD family membrane protein YckC